MRTRSWGWKAAPTTTSPSRSASGSCWPGSAPSCASSRQSEDAVFTIGRYTFRPASKLLVDEERNQKVRLTEKETAILKYLYRIGNKVVGRDVLLGEVWGYNAGVTTHTLETHVYRLRQKIERDPSNAEILVTEPGGYRLVP